MVNLPGPVDETVALATLVTVLENREAYIASVNFTARLGRGVRDAALKLGHRRFERLWVPWRRLLSN